MVRRHSVLAGVVCGITSFLWGMMVAHADTPLSHADIQQLRNQVDLIPDGASARPAQLEDQLVPGDALATNQDAFAQLQFNDGSLARVGELVLFRFQPDTRTFELDNGTMLLLIPPRQGTSRLRTPNATAGIRGSGLFVRYIPGDTPAESTTLIGALTTSGIEISNLMQSDNEGAATENEVSESEAVELEAGNMAVIVGDRPPQLFTFDLDVFYQTSALVQGLDLEGESTSIWREESEDGAHTLSIEENSDAAGTAERDPIALVREETRDGLLSQAGTLIAPFVDNPAFIYQAWQPNTVWLPLGPTDEFNPTDTVDDIIESGDVQTPSMEPGIPAPTGVGEPPNPVAPTPPIEPPFAPAMDDPSEPSLGPQPVDPPPFEPIDPPDQPGPVEPPVIPTPTDPPDQPGPVEPPVDPTPTDPPDQPGPVEPPVDPTPTDPPDQPGPVEPPVDPTPTDPPDQPGPVEPPVDPTPNNPPPDDPEPIEPPIDPNPGAAPFEPVDEEATPTTPTIEPSPTEPSVELTPEDDE